MKIIITYSVTLFLLFLCACNAAFDNEQNPQDENEPVTLTNWQYFEGMDKPDSIGWKNIRNLSELPGTYAENSLWLRTILPEWKGRSPAIYIGQIDYFMRVFLNKELIYQLGDSLSLRNAKFVGWNQNLVELPYFEKGDILSLQISTEKESANILKNILLGSSGKIISEVFTISFSSLFFSILFFTVGIIIIILNFSILKSKLLTGIAVFITSISLLYASNALILQVMLKLPSLYYHLDYISLMSTTTSGFFAVEQVILKKYKSILTATWQSHFTVLILSVLIINLTNITSNDILPWFLIFLTISMVICFAAMVLSTKVGNRESKILFLGMSGFFFFAVVEIILYFNVGLYSNFGFSIRVLHLGVICFVISLVWIVVQDYLKANKQKETARLNELEAIKRENEVRQHFAMKLMQSQENERNRIALELHDSIGQKLLLIKNRLLTNIRKEPEQSKSESLKKISDLTGETIQEIRDISWDLRPQHLDQLGLTTAIETLVEKVRESSGIKFNLKIDNIDDLIPRENEINLFRIIQESINNIVKHSQATEAFISIKRNNNMFRLEIKDNGIGMNRKVKTEGLGLTGMHERAGILGAELNINFSQTSGTSINMEYQSKQVIK